MNKLYVFCLCIAMTSSFIFAKPSKITLLRLLAEGKISNRAYEKLMIKMISMESLDVSQRVDLTPQMIIDKIKTNSLCKKINLEGCKEATDDVISAIVKYCPCLQEIIIGACPVTREGIENLVRHCSHLRFISFCSCYEIDDDLMSIVAQCCPDLEKIVLKNCLFVTAKGIENLVRYCHRLREFYFYNERLQKSFDNTVILLSENCPDLEKIIIAFCDITDLALRKLVYNCKKLKFVDISSFDSYFVTPAR